MAAVAEIGAVPAAGGDEKAQRVRDLLSSYYGNNAPAGGPDASTVNARAHKLQAGGLDSTNFDADRYLSQLLRQARLKELMQKHIEMSTQIKTLDSDMQNLVYENYNKFISATDTIRSMKAQVGSMDTSMLSLKDMIESVADRSSAINAKLQTRRDHIEELNQVRSLLFKLQAVFDLPKRLQVAIDQGALEVAVNSYADAAPLLKQYGHKGAFRKVAAEAQAGAKKLTQLLRQRLVEHNDEAAECIQMVRKLGGPIESLQEDFLSCMQKRMSGILEHAATLSGAVLPSASGTPSPDSYTGEQKAAAAAWGFPEGQAITLGHFAVQLDQRFLTELGQTGALFGELFGSAGRAQLVKVTRAAFADYLKLVRGALTEAASNYALLSARGLTANATASSDKQGPKDWGAGSVAEALYTISTDVSRMQSLLPELSPQDRGTEVVEGVVRHHISACFGALESSAIAAVEDVGARVSQGTAAESASSSASSQPLQQAYGEVTAMLARGLRVVVKALKGYQGRQWALLSWQDVFVDRVQAQLQHMLLTLLSRFLQLTGTPVQAGSELAKALPHAGAAAARRTISEDSGTPASRPAEEAEAVSQPPGVLLLLARVCTFLETEAVVQVMETLAATFPGQGGGSGGDQPPAFVAGKVARVAGASSAALLSAYVYTHSARMSLAVRRSAAAVDWLHAKEPRAARPVCQLLLERLAEVEGEVGQLVGGGSQQGGAGVPPGGNVGALGSRGGAGAAAQGYQGAGGSNALERNVARLFREHVSLFGEVQFMQSSILAAVACAGLKSLVETVRLQTLNRAGMQQLQLDVHFLRPALRRYATGSEGAAIHHLLDEVVTAATERSTEPQLLDAALMDRILASSR